MTCLIMGLQHTTYDAMGLHCTCCALKCVDFTSCTSVADFECMAKSYLAIHYIILIVDVTREVGCHKLVLIPAAASM